jgi:predicted nucleic acid-binding protein
MDYPIQHIDMTRKIFADTGFLVGLIADKDKYNVESVRIFEHLQLKHLISDVTDLYISDHIIIEVIHQLIRLHIPIGQIKEEYKKLNRCNVFRIAPEHVDEAFSTKLTPFCHNQSKERPMGIVDALSLVAMDYERITYIISYDGHFHKIPLIIRIKDIDSINHIYILRS